MFLISRAVYCLKRHLFNTLYHPLRQLVFLNSLPSELLALLAVESAYIYLLQAYENVPYRMVSLIDDMPNVHVPLQRGPRTADVLLINLFAQYY